MDHETPIDPNTLDGSTIEDTPVERSVTIDAPRERAWELLTNPDDLPGWLGTDVDLDPTPGSAGHVVDHDGTRRQLVIDEVVPGERIAWRWWVDGDSNDQRDVSRVAITLTPAIDGTRVDVVEHRLPSAAATVTASTAGTGAVNFGVRRAWGHRLLHLELLALLVVHARA